MKRVLVTGANGQLGTCIKDAAVGFTNLECVFATKSELNIADKDSVESYFEKNHFDYCINTAAYTNVEKAESEEEQAFLINAEAAKLVAKTCKKHDVVLLHVSTDYVFDGTKNEPYIETDITNPINVYGASKLKGEVYIKKLCEKHFIIRTSWLYSQYGHNFLNNMVKYAEQGKPLTITTEQTGTPTNANDLAQVLLKCVDSNNDGYGLYHFSNSGKATWYDFAKEILERTGLIEKTKLAQTDYYRTFAKRPVYSILNTSKIEKGIGVKTIDWKESLKTLLALKNSTLH
ncbi:MAG: dTDP-4-dehydrorhamnose reductase [Flavobacteriaceae bacterium]|nr:dTDP-4-dehydrorhamnose reductase [Flavobacteriaceae bacterium]|tara:strand:- start:13225 stop:14091 length:867 start_codon:yes stop_codon:yes gene_type:complete